jgi:uncharacterized protein DUF6916
MKPTRRSFLAGAGTLLAAAAATPLEAIVPAHGGANNKPNVDAWVKGRPQSEVVSQFQWTQDTFTPLVNSNFQVSDSQGNRILLRLVSVEDLRKQNVNSATAFALHFQLVSGKALPQGTYEFYTPSLGKFLLFVVASTKSKGAPYIAIVNRL